MDVAMLGFAMNRKRFLASILGILGSLGIKIKTEARPEPTKDFTHEEAMYLINQIRYWLDQGMTIQANGSGPVLQRMDNGIILGGLLVTSRLEEPRNASDYIGIAA